MPTGTQAGHRPKFWDCPGQAGTPGNYDIEQHNFFENRCYNDFVVEKGWSACNDT